ncbi:MAG: Fic family protein [bacterium]|nr:Fic family protein [bacterium]
MEKSHNIDKEIEEIIASGKYPVVTLDILRNLESIKVFDITKDHLEYTLDLYKNYLSAINKLTREHKVCFLETLKASEIMDNQKLEKENSFLISLYMTVMGNNSIDEIIKLDSNKMTEKDMIKIQKLLLEGTINDKNTCSGYRQNNRKFVGSWNYGTRNIQYFPIRYNEIEEASNKFLELYNQEESSSIEELLIKPFMIHGLLASLQLFNDGNTRLSRLLQHAKLWQLTNKTLDTNLELPAIYISRSYYPYREEYRNKIKNIAVNMDNDSWNDWFNFNLNRLEDQLFYMDNNLEEYQKII